LESDAAGGYFGPRLTLAVCGWNGLIGSAVELTVLWLRRTSQPLLKLSDD
jgi:hypothetical protein